MSDGARASELAGRGLFDGVAEAARLSLASPVDWTEMSGSEHLVQFYETDAFLLDSLSGFVTAGLTAGETCVVVARPAIREGLEARLGNSGLDPASAREAGRYVSLDAADTLATVAAGGSPDPQAFAETVGGLVARAAEQGRGLRVFGEMVALLWAAGRPGDAVALERLWNDLRARHPFLLLCAYPLSGFGRPGMASQLDAVCSTHARVNPAESYTRLRTADERLREIIQLQQKARALEAEISERKVMEDALRTVTSELEIQVEDLRRLHELSRHLSTTLELAPGLQEVLRAALAVPATDLGLLSLRDPRRDGLGLHAQSGFDEGFLKAIEWVPPGDGACGTCYRERRRIVIEDVEADPTFAPYREAARAAGVRACHSTPLVTRDGGIAGVLTVHFRRPHRPSQREVRLMDLYAQMAADFIENAGLHRQLQDELKAREQLLSREQLARAEAEAANRMKDEFLATVSHELRTPLNAIIGWTHMLRGGKLDEATAARAVETIERSARSQAQLIEDILDVSRMVRGQLRLSFGSVDLASVITAAIDSVLPAVESKSVRLEVTLDPSVRRVWGDAGRLQQVVWNLLSNAIKFTPAGGRIEVRLGLANGHVQLAVSDTGQGISADFLPFIFDRFRQGDGSATRRHGGVGLGLSIVRHLVENHGGTVVAESTGDGRGATFTIRLPLGGDRARTRSTHARVAGPEEEADRALGPLPDLGGVRVLIVDDDPDTRQMLTVALTERKATVQDAASVAEALETLAWYRPDVIVSDLAMPGEDGYVLIRKLRARAVEGERRIPAVALTAYARIEDRARALGAGFSMFVAKPVDPHELIRTIASLIDLASRR